MKRVLQSRQRNGAMKRSRFSRSRRFRGRDSRRNRLPHLGQAVDMDSGVSGGQPCRYFTGHEFFELRGKFRPNVGNATQVSTRDFAHRH